MRQFAVGIYEQSSLETGDLAGDVSLIDQGFAQIDQGLD